MLEQVPITLSLPRVWLTYEADKDMAIKIGRAEKQFQEHKGKWSTGKWFYKTVVVCTL